MHQLKYPRIKWKYDLKQLGEKKQEEDLRVI